MYIIALIALMYIMIVRYTADMSATKKENQKSIAEVRNSLAEAIEKARYFDETTFLTNRGKRVAVVVDMTSTSAPSVTKRSSSSCWRGRKIPVPTPRRTQSSRRECCARRFLRSGPVRSDIPPLLPLLGLAFAGPSSCPLRRLAGVRRCVAVG
jgi:hypothetical protein